MAGNIYPFLEVGDLNSPHICDFLHSLTTINIHHIIVKSDCLEVVNLINDVYVDLTKVSFFIEETVFVTHEMVDVSFSHVQQCHNVLTT